MAIDNIYLVAPTRTFMSLVMSSDYEYDDNGDSYLPLSSNHNLWEMLREFCEDCQGHLNDWMTDNDGIFAPEEILNVTFIKNRLSKIE